MPEQSTYACASDTSVLLAALLSKHSMNNLIGHLSAAFSFMEQFIHLSFV